MRHAITYGTLPLSAFMMSLISIFSVVRLLVTHGPIKKGEKFLLVTHGPKIGKEQKGTASLRCKGIEARNIYRSDDILTSNVTL